MKPPWKLITDHMHTVRKTLHLWLVIELFGGDSYGWQENHLFDVFYVGFVLHDVQKGEVAAEWVADKEYLFILLVKFEHEFDRMYKKRFGLL